MKIHPREELVRNAERDLFEALVKWRNEHDGLTLAEELRVVQKEFGSWISRMAKYAIRHERHGDADKPGGLE